MPYLFHQLLYFVHIFLIDMVCAVNSFCNLVQAGADPSKLCVVPVSYTHLNLIMNHAFKLDDMGKTTSLAYSLAEQKDDLPLLLETKEVAQAEIDALPDGMVGLSEMHEYGYLWNEMLPLTKERASELFEEGMEVYLLHSDGSETLAEDWGAVQGHDGLFGVEQDDWSAYLEQGLEEDAPSPEMRLLYGNESRFGIYQLKDTEETRDIRFMACLLYTSALKPKNCTVCGVEYVPRSGISKYCPACAKKIQREKSNESKRRSRERNRQACIELSAKNDRLTSPSAKACLLYTSRCV